MESPPTISTAPWKVLKIDPPSKFLEQYPLPQVDDFEGLFSFEALPYMVVCLYAYPEMIPSFSNHMDFDDNLAGTTEATNAAVEWFTELSSKLQETLDLGEVPSAYLDFYLTEKHGASHWIRGKNIELNVPHHAEKFFLTDRIAYDESTRKFYQYQSTTGLWNSISQERLLGVAARYWKRLATDLDDPRLQEKVMTKRTSGFLKSFIQFGASECHFLPCQKSSILHAQDCMVKIVAGKDRRRIDFSPMFFSRERLNVPHIKSRDNPEEFLKYLGNVISSDVQRQ